MIWISAVLLTVASPAASDDKAFVFNIITANGEAMVCEDLTTSRPVVLWQAEQWMLGLWSGLNMAFGAAGVSRGNVGSSTASNGVLGEIRLYCTRNPSALLPHAVRDTYVRLRDANK